VPPIPRFPLLLGPAVVALLAVATPAPAAYVGAGSDPQGDAPDGNPAHDIVAFGASYRPADGALVGVVRLAADGAGADGHVRIQLMAGRRTPAGCVGYPSVGFRSYPSGGGALVRWVRFAQAGDPRPKDGFGRQQASDGGRTWRFEVTDRTLAGLQLDCALAWTHHDQSADAFVDTSREVTLRAQPELTATLGTLPASQRVGQRRTVRVTLRNPGHAKTGRIRLSVGKARGLAVRHAKTVAALKPGAKRTVTLTTTLTSRAKATTRLRVTASAGDLRTRIDGQLRRASRSSGSGSGSGSPRPPQLCNRWLPDITGNSGGSLTLVPC
jgi:hypothetical protein